MGAKTTDQDQVVIDGKSLTIEQVSRISREYIPVTIAPDAWEQVERSRNMVDNLVKDKQIAYGITTGFGQLCDTVISPEDAEQLQENLIMSHACGMGDPFPADVVRAIMALRLNALILGYSGIHPQTVSLLCEMINRKVHPIIPQQGSLGASGDLAPLAHMVLVMIGKGEAEYQGKIYPGKLALKRAGLTPVRLRAKEGLALINGTQVMTALLALSLYDGKLIADSADLIASLSVEALHGIPAAYDDKIHLLRPHPGQRGTAANLRRYLHGSERVSKPGEIRVQDAYSLRCIPQVHGATRDALEYVWEAVSREMNSVTDNPLLFPETGEVISGGNFHGQPMALAADFLAMAIAELGSISERRTERLVNPTLSGLPSFLTQKSGLHSGMMIPQYVAASIVSENKTLCMPSSVDSIPSSANQEDHVSMGTNAARKLKTVVDNTAKILAIEWLCAAQGVEFGTGKLGDGTSQAYHLMRQHIPKLKNDRELYRDMDRAYRILIAGSLLTQQ